MIRFQIQSALNERKRGFQVWIGNPEENLFCTSVEMQKYSEGEYVPNCMVLQKEELQDIMNELWRHGIRPSLPLGEQSNTISAMEDHMNTLKDVMNRTLKVILKE